MSEAETSRPRSAAEAVRVGARASVRVPASSGNVGPGYDSLGLALARYDDLTVECLPEGLEFDLQGPGSEDVPRTEEHLVVQSMAAAWEAAGLTGLPGLRLSAVHRIPHSRGMGSSASAIVAGVVAANQLLPEELRLSGQQVLQVCSELEGHPDNVAPSLYGGLVVSWSEGAAFRSLPVDVLPQITPVVAVPDYQVSTRLARSLVPDTVPHHEAAADAGRTALLALAMTRAPQHLLSATEDFLHQQYRAEAMQPSADLVLWLRDRRLPAIVSGAGPTVLVLAQDGAQAGEAVEAVQAFQASPQSALAGRRVSWDVETLAIDRQGATLVA